MTTASDSMASNPAAIDIEPTIFRRVLGHFLTGVVVVSTMDGEQPAGLAIGSFFSISLAPPLVGFCAANSSETWPIIKRAGRFCINVLAADQEAVCRQFARSGAEKFDGVGWSTSEGGCPRLDDVIAWIDCDIACRLRCRSSAAVTGSAECCGAWNSSSATTAEQSPVEVDLQPADPRAPADANLLGKESFDAGDWGS
jgi:3-hydroxy-9,10-secoandrosta-1,3,5(10)-triene-9,17-dione monooxygenase reductase component